MWEKGSVWEKTHTWMSEVLCVYIVEENTIVFSVGIGGRDIFIVS